MAQPHCRIIYRGEVGYHIIIYDPQEYLTRERIIDSHDCADIPRALKWLRENYPNAPEDM